METKKPVGVKKTDKKPITPPTPPKGGLNLVIWILVFLG